MGCSMTSLKDSSEIVSHLLELLDSQTAVLRDEMAPLLKRKQRALVANDLSQLQELADKEQAIAGQLAALESERIPAVTELAQQYNINADDAAALSLGELVQLLPDGEARGKLAEHAAALKDSLCELAWANEDNRHLTQNLLDYTAMVVRLVTQGEAQPGYTAAGKVADGTAERAILDDHI
jgi:flagellar biosynthesis/type III secretory pathway chaperone